MDMAVRSHTARASLAWRLAAGVAALVTAASLGGPAYAEEATPNSSQAAQTPAVATSQAPDQQTASADGVAIQESGITFTMPATTQQNASGWWEYVDDDIKLYLKAFPNYASAPDLALDGPDEAWAKEYAQAKEAQERELTPSVSFDYVDHLDYQVGDTTFYAYLFLEQEEGSSPASTSMRTCRSAPAAPTPHWSASTSPTTSTSRPTWLTTSSPPSGSTPAPMSRATRSAWASMPSRFRATLTSRLSKTRTVA